MSWINETSLPDGGIEFKVRQLKYRPLFNVGKMILVCALILGVLAALSPVTGGVTGIFLLVFGVIFLFAILFGFIAAIFAALSRTGNSTIQVSEEGISVRETGKLRTYQRSQVSDICCILNDKTEVDSGQASQQNGGSILVMPGRAAASMGSAAGRMGASVLKDCSAAIGINYTGKRILIARYLSDDQASFLHSRIIDAYNLS